MQGAVFFGDRKAGLREFPEPESGSGEVVVAVRASGMCGSDLHYYRSTPGSAAATSGQVIMGHEPAGVVHAVGPGVPADIAAVGDRVMIHHYARCTRCDSCRTGWPQMCTRVPVRYFGTHEHGGHAPLLKVPAVTLVSLDDSLSFAAGAAIVAAPARHGEASTGWGMSEDPRWRCSARARSDYPQPCSPPQGERE